MKREQLQKWWKEIEAFKEGKKIQSLNDYGYWIDITDPLFLSEHKYRVKPESKYVPFEEEDLFDLVGRIVIHRSNRIKSIVTRINKNAKEPISIYGVSLTPQQFLEEYIFEDGKPCGKLLF